DHGGDGDARPVGDCYDAGELDSEAVNECGESWWDLLFLDRVVPLACAGACSLAGQHLMAYQLGGFDKHREDHDGALGGVGMLDRVRDLGLQFGVHGRSGQDPRLLGVPCEDRVKNGLPVRATTPSAFRRKSPAPRFPSWWARIHCRVSRLVPPLFPRSAISMRMAPARN